MTAAAGIDVFGIGSGGWHDRYQKPVLARLCGLLLISGHSGLFS